ncbi:MAG TPA: hypothetical protein VI731_06300, partial [Bacteroidia bacterium]|nr:hypothetical protein [Bacteroidia bacterium]
MKLSSLFFARSILTAGLLFFILTGHAQLSGIKNIPGDYPTLAAAVTDLNSQGVGPGGVVFNMNAGETAPAGGYDITATGTFPDQVVFNGNGNVITASAAQTPGSLNDAIFKITGADFITISAFTMQENAANTDMTPGTNTMTEWGVALLYMSATNGAKSNN